jgi:hypothetical protein
MGGASMRRRDLLLSAMKPSESMIPLDYGLSFLHGVAPWNSVRFWVESRTRIIDEKTGRHEDFLQCASCKSEDTFAPQNLFYKDNYDFLPIFGPAEGVVFRRKASLNPGYRQIRASREMWDGQKLGLKLSNKLQLLRTTAAIRKATHAGFPLVAQTEIHDPSTALRAIIEFPVKTINIHDEKDLYQVDTGPIAFPDLSQRRPRLAESISLAFVAFNARHFADFVIEDVTPIEGARIHHYSRLRSQGAQNRLYACKR